MKVTVAIATWNRAALLDRTLEVLRDLRVPAGVEWELLVVNNNCTDDTDAVLARHMDALPLRRLFEPTQGHSHARNCAIAAASGELMLWTDDDVLVDPEWVSEYLKAARERPDAAFFGGTIDPWFAVDPPGWIKRHVDRLDTYVITQHGPGTRDLGPADSIAGANMAFRTDVLKRFLFNVEVGRVKDGLVGADDTELFRRLRAADKRGVWVGSAKVQHYIPADRLTLDYVGRWYAGAGRTHIRLNGMPHGEYFLDAPRWVLRQYAQAWVKALCYSPFKGQRWLAAFRKACMLRGMIHESREQRARIAAGQPAHSS